MSNYNSLKATINANIKTNGNQEITGSVMNSVLNAMVNSLGAGYQYAGVATPSTNPGTPDNKVFYIASTPGTYQNFGGLVVASGEVAVFAWDSSWHKEKTGAATKDELDRLDAEVNGISILNPANLLTDPTFAERLWELQNGSVVYSDVDYSLSQKASVERINTGASAYFFLRLPVSLFQNGQTYRISIINSTGSQYLSVRNDNGSGFVGYILADVSMTTQSLGGGRYLHTYDWVVNSASFGSYGYVQIAFKFYDGFYFEEPFLGLASGNTNYAIPQNAVVVKKSEIIDGLTSNSAQNPLSARQGKVLNEKIEALPVINIVHHASENLCPGEFYDNKYYGSGTGEIRDGNNYACAKPFLLPAGTYVYRLNKQMFGSGSPYVYIFANPTDTIAASSITATLLQEVVVRGYTMGIYTFTLTEESYVGLNVGVLADKADFMVVAGSSASDYPSEYIPYFEPYDSLPEDLELSDASKKMINPLIGCVLAVDGDSICEGAGYVGGYAKMIGEQNDMSVVNHGVSGGTITYGTRYSNNTDRHWICTSVASLPQDADYYILEGGVNDCGNQVTIGDLVAGYPQKGSSDTLDKETLIGAMEYMCRDLVTLFPGKKCGFIFVHGIFGNDSELRVYWAEAKEKMIRALKKWGVPFIDLESLVPPLNCIPSLKSVYTNNGDGWHPNELGYEKFYVEQIAAWMKTL